MLLFFVLTQKSPEEEHSFEKFWRARPKPGLAASSFHGGGSHSRITSCCNFKVLISHRGLGRPQEWTEASLVRTVGQTFHSRHQVGGVAVCSRAISSVIPEAVKGDPSGPLRQPSGSCIFILVHMQWQKAPIDRRIYNLMAHYGHLKWVNFYSQKQCCQN